MTEEYLGTVLSQMQQSIMRIERTVEKTDEKIDKLDMEVRTSFKSCQDHSEGIHKDLYEKVGDVSTTVTEMVGCAKGKQQWGNSTILVANIVVLAVFMVIAAIIQRGW